MRFSPQLIVVIVAIALFYLRIALLRGKKKRLEREFALKRRKVKGRSKGAMLPEKNPGAPPFSVSSWWLIALAIVLMLAGLLAYTRFTVLGWQIIKDPALLDSLAKFWHWAVALGVIVFAFGFTIDMPRDASED